MPKKHFCDLCKVWVPDDSVSRKRHDAAGSHKKRTQEAVERSIKETQLRSQQEAEINATLAEIEAKARGYARSTATTKAHPLAHVPTDLPEADLDPPKPKTPDLPRKRPLEAPSDANTGVGVWQEVSRPLPVPAPAGPATKQTGAFAGMKLSVVKKRKLDLSEEQ